MRWDIHPGYLRELSQHIGFRRSVPITHSTGFFEDIENCHCGILAVTQDKAIEKFRQWLGVECNRPTAYDNWIFPVLSFEWKPGEIDNLENIGEAHLVSKSEPKCIEFSQGSDCFEGIYRQAIFTQYLFHVHPRGITSFGCEFIP